MAGFGAADVHRRRRSATTPIAVFGCGGVGNAAIAAARARGRAHDHRASTSTRGSSSGRRSSARRTPSTRRRTDPVEAIRALTDGNGADVCIEAVGRPEVLKQAFYARDLAGTVVQVGVPTPDMALPDIPMIDFFGRGGALKPSWYGDCLPSRDFPTLIDLYLQGRFPLDKFVSETIALDEVEDAFHKMERGEVLRSVVVLVGVRRVALSRGRSARSSRSSSSSVVRPGAQLLEELRFLRRAGPTGGEHVVEARARDDGDAVGVGDDPVALRAPSTSPTTRVAADAARLLLRRAAQRDHRREHREAVRFERARRRARRRRSRGPTMPRASAPVVSTSPQ